MVPSAHLDAQFETDSTDEGNKCVLRILNLISSAHYSNVRYPRLVSKLDDNVPQF